VSDYRPNSSSQSKLKKQSTDGINLELVQNPDILATLCALKTSLQKVVGFALETENGSVYAKEKLVRKKADAIVLNTLSAKTGFESNTNEVKVYFAHGTEVELPLQDKERLGEGLMQYFVNEFGL
jgi:phosphopantothenoylcysteine decarboxylase/phosphopantothenate--cysteine ligase